MPLPSLVCYCDQKTKQKAMTIVITLFATLQQKQKEDEKNK
jgi:hypothetical protein